MKNRKIIIILIIIVAIAALFAILYSYYKSKYSVMTAERIEWCESDCDEGEYCNHKRQICSNRTNWNINCNYVGDNKCYKKCESDFDCGTKKCVSIIDCSWDICDIDAEELGLPSHGTREVKICQ